METRDIQDVVNWAKTTDIAELAYRRGGEGLSLELESASGRVPEAAFPPCRLIPVLSPGVGLLRWSALGSARKAEQGVSVRAGQTLALLEAGRSVVEITATASGRIEAVAAEEGRALDYGQPVLFLAPGP